MCTIHHIALSCSLAWLHETACKVSSLSGKGCGWLCRNDKSGKAARLVVGATPVAFGCPGFCMIVSMVESDLPWFPGLRVVMQEWQECKGSKAGRRGYTCGLWLLLHSLAAESQPEQSGGAFWMTAVK